MGRFCVWVRILGVAERFVVDFYDLEYGSAIADEEFEWFGEFRFDVTVVEDQDLLEERLVELTAEFLACDPVRGLAARDEAESRLDNQGDCVELQADGCQQMLDAPPMRA